MANLWEIRLIPEDANPRREAEVHAAREGMCKPELGVCKAGRGLWYTARRGALQAPKGVDKFGRP